MVIPTNEGAENFEKLMRLRVEVMVASFFAQNKGGEEASEDFFTAARKAMSKKDPKLSLTAFLNTTLLFSASDKVLDLIREDASMLETTLKQLMAVLKQF